jgi:methionine synthase I (cobalamin-dependent)/5,10-methylenetetrahydrofolate reductase
MARFLERLHEKVLVCDGAMGTLLFDRGVPLTACCERMNIENPDLVKSIHAEYVAAGSDVIETNTFGANEIELARYGAQDQVEEINQAGARLAREAARDRAYVAGAVGPLGAGLDPSQFLSRSDRVSVYRRQMSALLDGHVDLILVETISSLQDLSAALEAARTLTDLPVICQMAYLKDGRTRMGISPAESVKVCLEYSIDVVGHNCGCGPYDSLSILEELAALTDLPISIQPNAGLPRFFGGRTVHLSDPHYFAHLCEEFVGRGANIVGGCCGTNPGYTEAIAQAVGALAPKKKHVHRMPTLSEKAPPQASLLGKNPIAQKLGKEFFASVEISPPAGADYSSLMAGIESLKHNGADAINVPDNPMASPRMNPVSFAHLIKERVGLNVILHLTCRDRNILGLQSELLGAAALDVDAILALTGDPSPAGPFPGATSVFDVDSEGLIKIIASMNRGESFAPKQTGYPTAFLIGAAVNPTADDLQREIEKLTRKIAAGANFIQTQPIYDTGALELFLERTGDLGVPVIAGLLPVRSKKMAHYFHYEVPGISLPESVLQQIEKATNRDEEKKIGLAIAARLLEKLITLVDGVCIMPMQNFNAALTLLSGLRGKSVEKGMPHRDP